ncbi:hypothetical protein [Litchfieldia salsa]|uniref:Uncharacterized protein n=1 Tax=Litchfieldia salsa TaxID=930152 RepID=A0A1H0PKM4_9BACI|nr:hypothetical protein [Litchfieldia salsa]SDP05178.1 hypothetical protein SAMN05216565_101345 [Litchfieldia salsa]
MKPSIELKKLSVHSISNSSGIFYGDNKLHHFKGSSSKNEGLGEISGDKNTVSHTHNKLIKQKP